MAGKYLIGIDGGTQSSKVVVYDLKGNVVCEGRRTLLPMEHPEPGVAVHPDDDLWESIVAASREAMTKFPGDPADIIGVGLCTIRCCKAFLKADGTLARAGHELDGHARVPALHPRRPRARLRDHLVRLHDAPLHRAVPRQRRQQHPPAVAHRHRHVAVERRSDAARGVQRQPATCWWSCRCPATSPAT